MNTVAISAAVSAVVTVVVGTLVAWGERVYSGIRRAVLPDHQAILSGGVSASSVATSSTDQVRVLVAVAPNRSLRRKTIVPDDAIRFVAGNFGDQFPREPVQSMPTYGVRFEAGEGIQPDIAWVRATGRVELSVAIPTTAADPGPISVSIVDVLRPILAIRSAVQSPAYVRTYGRRLPGFRRRFDWIIAVSQTVQVPGMGGQSWEQLMLPGAVPPRAGTRQQASCPADGYATRRLRSWGMGRPRSELIRVFLRAFLYENGYHDVDAAIEDVIRAVDTSQGAAGSRREALDQSG